MAVAQTHYQLDFGRGIEPACRQRIRTGRLTIHDSAVTCTTCQEVIHMLDNPINCHCGAAARSRGDGADICDFCFAMWEEAGEPDTCPCTL